MHVRLSRIIWWTLLFLAASCIVSSAHVNKGSKTNKGKPDKTKKVSSDQARNGGRKGPMSGGSSFPPYALPIPMIPLKTENKPDATKSKKRKKAEQNDQKKDSHKEYSIHEDKRKLKKARTEKMVYKTKGRKIVDKTLIRSKIDNTLTRLKREVDDEDDFDDEDSQVRKNLKKALNKGQEKGDTRLRGTLERDDHVLSDEEKQLNKAKTDKTKKVSSDKARNGGRKGPMSGGSSQGLPMPLAIPFPMIPLKTKNQPDATKSKKRKKAVQNDKKNDDHKEYSIHEDKRKLKKARTEKMVYKTKGRKTVDKTLIRSNIDNTLTRLKREVDDEDDFDDEDSQVRENLKKAFKGQEKRDTRFRRTLERNDHVLSDEEKQLAEEWITEEQNSLIPGYEDTFYMPPDFDFILKGHSVLHDAYMLLIPHLHKRSTDDDEGDYMFLNKNAEKTLDLEKRNVDDDGVVKKVPYDDVDLMFFNAAAELDRKVNVRDISLADENAEEMDESSALLADVEQDRDVREASVADEPPLSVEDATRRYADAEQAAEALTKIELKLGIDPEHLVQDTHKYVASLQAEKIKYDEDIRSHIEKAQEAEKRAKIAVHDEISKKSQITHDVVAAKRQLDDDRRKIEEINTELKQLKDIELMATGLEVAKYMAKERAKHNLDLAQSKATISQPFTPAPAYPPAYAPVQTSQPEQPVAPMISSQPSSNIMSWSQTHEPVGAAASLPSPLEQMYPSSPETQEHQVADQRNSDVRPTYSNSPLQLPLTQYFSNYIQSKNVMQNHFATVPRPQGPSMMSYPFQHQASSNIQSMPYASHGSFGTAESPEYHVGGDQRHMPSRVPPPSTYMIRPFQNTGTPIHYVTSFAKVSKPNHASVPDHEFAKTGDSHKGGNSDENKEAGGNQEGWESVSFPGTTYSPPVGPFFSTQPKPNSFYNQYPSQSIAAVQQPPPSFASYQRPQLAEALTAISPVQQYSQQSSLSSSPVMASYAALPPANLEPPNHTEMNQYVPPPQSVQSSIFPEHVFEMRPGSNTQAYASPSNQQAKVGQVIDASPQDEVVTVNSRPAPPPPAPPQPDMSGTLPGWMGAVDMAKYEEDVTDRLRERNGSNDKPNGQQSSVRREYLRLINAENQLSDTQKAASAVTHIESSVGFDPGSIAKMVDFVKTAAIKDVKLSQDAVEKDKQTLRKIRGDDIKKKSEITKKSDIDSVALDHAQSKLKGDEAVLADAQDRLSKIEKMEMIVTEIEVAKFYASIKAEKEVQGAKRTLEALKRSAVEKTEDKK